MKKRIEATMRNKKGTLESLFPQNRTHSWLLDPDVHGTGLRDRASNRRGLLQTWRKWMGIAGYQ